MTQRIGTTSVLEGTTDHDRATVTAARDSVVQCIERVSVEFDHWDTPHVRGPGLYVVVATGPVAAFAEPMGANRWPVADCPNVFAGEGLVETARSVALDCDGAVVVRDDGSIQPEMVRFAHLSPTERERLDLPYADWMGARHMSALETSARDEVFAVVTLSEEDGRVTVFTDGAFEDARRDVRVGD